MLRLLQGCTRRRATIYPCWSPRKAQAVPSLRDGYVFPPPRPAADDDVSAGSAPGLRKVTCRQQEEGEVHRDRCYQTPLGGPTATSKALFAVGTPGFFRQKSEERPLAPRIGRGRALSRRAR